MYDCYISHGYSILVSCIYPPIPDRNHDYCAHFDCFGEEGPTGFGKDAEAAIHDLWMAASAGDWFDEAFWDEFDRAEAETAEHTRENAAVDRAQERMDPAVRRRLAGDEVMTRDEAFEAMHQVLIGLQRSRTLSFEQTQALQRVVIDYGTACAQDAAQAVRMEMRS